MTLLVESANPDNFLIKLDANRYKLVIDGSQCRGEGCTQEENIVAVVRGTRAIQESVLRRPEHAPYVYVSNFLSDDGLLSNSITSLA